MVMNKRLPLGRAVRSDYVSCERVSKHIYRIKCKRGGIFYTSYTVSVVVKKKRFQRSSTSLEMAQIEEQRLLKLRRE